MHDISAEVRLRPIRIALLVSPTDLPAIRKFMRICTCLWGGAYNPIIPVFRRRPKEWRLERSNALTSAEVTRGYVEFFEPDVFVEARPNLLERAGLSDLRTTPGMRNHVISLGKFLSCDNHRDDSELEIGLSVIDVLTDIYQSERRFQLRDHRAAVIVKPSGNSALVAALFGHYPDDERSRYFTNSYRDVFKPTDIEASPDTWLKVYNEGAITPLNITAHKLETSRNWQNGPRVFVFDPSKGTDLIDLWNLRLEPYPVVPIPIDRWINLVGPVKEIIETKYGPFRGEAHRTIHHRTIEFARSIERHRRQESLSLLDSKGPQGEWSPKSWPSFVWKQRVNHDADPPHRLKITAQEKRFWVTVPDLERPTANFETLAPDFASMYGGGRHARWVNVVNLTSFHGNQIATVLPFNLSTPAWLRMGTTSDRVVVGTEGWSFSHRYRGSSAHIRLQSHEEAVIESLKHLGVEGSLSDSGHIAKQVLQHVGGLRGLHLLADADTLKLLNEMAGGTRRRKEGEAEVEEVFHRRTRSEPHWKAHLAKRAKRTRFLPVEMSQFTDNKVLRLGLSTNCPQCTAANWHSLSDVDYVITCERCLEQYPFPQGALRRKNDSWGYRVIGPFSTPDYARGSYGALLALRVINDMGREPDSITFSTAVELRMDDGPPCEIDYAAWFSRESFEHNFPPVLVFGEAKSFGGGDLITRDELDSLRRLASKFPNSAIVVSVLRPEFTENELRLLLPFVNWTRRLDQYSRPRNLVILLTGVELFHEFSVESTWCGLGGRYERFANNESTRSLMGLAQATQALHLDLPSFGGRHNMYR